MRSPILLTLLTLAFAADAAAADVVVTEKRVRDAFVYMEQEQPRLEQTVTTWFGDGVLRRDEASTSFILSAKANTLTIVDHEAKSLSVLNLPIDIESYIPEAMRPQLREFRDAMKLEATVTPTETTEQIAGFEAKRVDIVAESKAVGMRTELEMWISKGISVDHELFALAARTLAALQPASGDFVEKLIALDGYPVRTVTKSTSMGAETSTREEVVSVETKTAPEGWYLAPADYTTKPFNPMAAGG